MWVGGTFLRKKQLVFNVSNIKQICTIVAWMARVKEKIVVPLNQNKQQPSWKNRHGIEPLSIKKIYIVCDVHRNEGWNKKIISETYGKVFYSISVVCAINCVSYQKIYEFSGTHKLHAWHSKLPIKFLYFCPFLKKSTFY